MTNRLKYSAKMTDADIVKGMASVKTRSKTLRTQVVAIATSILHQWATTGDVKTASVRATQLMGSVDQAHAQKVVNWFGVYAGFELEEDSLRYSADKTTLEATEYQAALKETLYDLTKDADLKPFVFRKRLEALVKAAKAKRTKGLTTEDEISDSDLAAVEALLS